MIYRQRWGSPMGDVLLQATSDALTGIWFFDQKYVPVDFVADGDATGDTQSKTPSGDHSGTQQSAIIDASIDWLQRYYANEDVDPNRPALKPAGTEFQKVVWNALLKIPYGQTTTYGGLAQTIGKPRAVRAVAAAVGRNPISLLIPCHRVIGANGSLTGYAGGLNRKEGLLALEHAGATQLELV